MHCRSRFPEVVLKYPDCIGNVTPIRLHPPLLGWTIISNQYHVYGFLRTIRLTIIFYRIELIIHLSWLCLPLPITGIAYDATFSRQCVGTGILTRLFHCLSANDLMFSPERAGALVLVVSLIYLIYVTMIEWDILMWSDLWFISPRSVPWWNSTHLSVFVVVEEQWLV